MRRYAGIYVLHSETDGKYYLGMSSNLRSRMFDHFRHLRNGVHSCKPLQEAYDRYGKDDFTFTAIYGVEVSDDLYDTHYGHRRNDLRAALLQIEGLFFDLFDGFLYNKPNFINSYYK